MNENLYIKSEWEIYKGIVAVSEKVIKTYYTSFLLLKSVLLYNIKINLWNNKHYKHLEQKEIIVIIIYQLNVVLFIVISTFNSIEYVFFPE